MAEALGVASSIAGLISLADSVVRLGFKYFKDVKSAPESIEKLIRETNNLAGVLHSLRNVVEILEAKYQSNTSVQIHEINACQKTLDIIESRLSRFLHTRTSNRFKWPFEKSAVEGLIRDIETHKTAMAIAMDAKEMSVLINLLDGQRNIMHGLASVQATLKSGQDKWEKVELNETRRKLLGLLGTLDVRKWQNTNIRLRQPGTGVWFTDGSEFRSWLSTDCSKLWVHGIPGAGKTILIASAIQEIEKIIQSSNKHAIAIFYCDYKDSETHDPRTILGALTRQLVVRNEDCFAQLANFCEAHNMDEHTLGTATIEDIRDLIIELSYNFESVSIVVDGLDEINEDRADVTALLDSLNTPHGRIRTLLASRKEVDIEWVLSTYPKISIAARSADLRLYVRSEIEKRSSKGKLQIQDPDLKDHIIKVLTEGADGMFRWVACQIDYLCECSTDDDRRDALNKLPPDLPSSYERILERVNRSTPENQAIVRRALQWIVYSRGVYQDRIYRRSLNNGEQLSFENRPFGTVELLQALSVRPGARAFKKSSMPEEDRILHWCSSLIRQKSDIDGFEIAHFTVKEFLLAIDPIKKPQFAQYRLSGNQAELAITCMTFLRYAEFDGLPSPIGVFDQENFIVSWNNLARKCPFAAYSVRFWYNHISQSQWNKVERVTLDFLDQNSSDSLWKLEKCQNDLWNGGNHFMGSQNRMTTTESLLQTLSPLHWASMFALSNACKSLILERGADVNRQSLAGTPMCCAITASTFYLTSKIPHPGEEMTLYESLDPRATEAVLELLVMTGADFEAKIDPNGKCAALLLAMEHISCGRFYDGHVVLALLHAGAWLSREHALFVLADEWFIKDLSQSDSVEDSNQGKILEWAAETDFKFISKDAFPILFILALDTLAWWSECSVDLVSQLHTYIYDDDIPACCCTLRYQNIFPGPDGQALASFSSEQCKSNIVEPETQESETSDLETFESEGERSAKQLLLAIRISSKNLVSAVEPAIFALIKQDRLQVVSCLLQNGVEIDFNWVGLNENSILHTFLDRADESRLSDTFLFDLLLSQGIDFDNIDSDGRHSLEIMAAPRKLSMFRRMWNAMNTVETFARSPDLPLKILRAAGKYGASVGVLKFTISRLFECRSAYRATVHEYLVNSWINDFCAERRPPADKSEDGPISEDNLLAKHQEGNTKIHLLSSNHGPLASIELMELIWADDGHESERDTLNGMNLTPLAIAVRSKNNVAMKLLLHAGVNTMQRLQNGQTVLHLACMLGNDEAVEALLQSGMDVSVKDDFGYTAADVAEQNGQTGVAGLIKEHIGDSLGDDKLAQMSDRELGGRSGADTVTDGDSEVMDWAPEVYPTPAAVIPASLDQKRAKTMKLVHRPSKEAIRSAEDLGIGEGQMIWEVDRAT